MTLGTILKFLAKIKQLSTIMLRWVYYYYSCFQLLHEETLPAECDCLTECNCFRLERGLTP